MIGLKRLENESRLSEPVALGTAGALRDNSPYCSLVKNLKFESQLLRQPR